MRCVIFGAAPIRDYDFHASQMREDDFVICADGGLRHAERLELNPDRILGDFDSFPGEVTRKDALVFPAEKDDTDMGLAIKFALRQGMGEICIFGGLGGRLDHTLANIHLLKYAMDQGAFAYLADENMFVTLIQGEYSIHSNPYKYISVLPFGGRASGVTYQGLKYPLTDAVFETGNPYGVSNEMTGKTAKITVGEGTLLLIMTKDI